MEVAIALGFAILFGACGDIFLSNGMRSNDEISVKRINDIPPLIVHVFKRPWILAGVISMTFYFFAYIAALAWVDVSVANPLTALSYVLVTVYAVLFMQEKVGLMRWTGVLCVTLGAIFVGISS